MRFLRVGPAGSERPVVLDSDGTARDLSPLTVDIDGVFLAEGGVERVRAALAENVLPRTDIASTNGSARRSHAPARWCASGSTTSITLRRRTHRPLPSRSSS